MEEKGREEMKNGGKRQKVEKRERMKQRQWREEIKNEGKRENEEKR